MSEKKKNLSDIRIESTPDHSRRLIGIVVSEWNSQITEALTAGAISTLLKAGIKQENIIRVNVPGSFELPFAAQRLLEREYPDAVICIGCIVQGETPHFEFISQAVAHGIMRVGLDFGRPVVFGVLTTITIEQAIERSGGIRGNKGVEAAATALNLAGLLTNRPSEEV